MKVSSDCNRCCCSPYHPFKLEVRQHIPTPMQYLSPDFAHGINGFQYRDERQNALVDLYHQAPVLFTIIRNDGQRVCAFPCKWLNTCVFCSFCQDGVKIYAGPTPTKVKGMCDLGRPNKYEDSNRIIGSVTQPICGGCCHPEVHLKEGSGEDITPFGKANIFDISYYYHMMCYCLVFILLFNDW